ncbi:STAS domain-containing protein [Streptomyces sp. S.PB5]|uniref:STAS domain-containing protein n=1 Tax=Streptomyces sp. S.PB5 TaxID=3020844 RepID=UPI0025AFE8B5|nr:STAS domain-containing protein [Streptomyces sp. S.PB5]MDN3024324.1 STAS domain-containing protein [Streptomyces sp. S.PB5]
MHDNILEAVDTVTWPPGEHTLRRAADGLLVAGLRGDMDLATATHLSFWLDSLVAVVSPAYVVDLREVSFFDSTGLNLLLRFRRRVIETDRGFALLCDPGQLRLLRAHGTLELLNPSTTLAEAVSGLMEPAPPPRRNGRP